MSLQVLEDVSGNAVLNLINDGSLSLLDGMDALLLKYLWRRAGHPDRNLASALQGLLEAGLIEVVPGPDMAVRLSTRAFAALQQAWRAAPGSAAEGDDSPDWDSVEQGPVQAGGMGAARSELQLRLHVIGIYAELSVPANGRISAASMAHIWAQLRHRGEELRHAVDLLQRDGHVRVLREGGVAYFVLTEAGFHYATGRPPPAQLIALAPPARNQDRRIKTLSDQDWIDLLLGELARAGLAQGPDAISFSEIESVLAPLRLHGFAAIHAAELAHRQALLEWSGASDAQFLWLEAGRTRARQAMSGEVQARVRDALLAADHTL